MWWSPSKHSDVHRINHDDGVQRRLPPWSIMVITTRGTGSEKNTKSILRKVMGLKLWFANKTIRSKGKRESHLYVISNRFQGREALAIYRQRWGIEQLFSHLKRRGFDLEATHMSEASKIEKLFAIVTLAFLFSYAWGVLLEEDALNQCRHWT